MLRTQSLESLGLDLKSHPCHLLALRPQEHSFTSLSLSFLKCKMKERYPTLRTVSRVNKIMHLEAAA